jgi:hypothetical protein
MNHMKNILRDLDLETKAETIWDIETLSLHTECMVFKLFPNSTLLTCPIVHRYFTVLISWKEVGGGCGSIFHLFLLISVTVH